MILFELTCRRDHVFEGWFRDSGAYESQRKARKITCPVCGDTRIGKAPMAPRIAKSREAGGKAKEKGDRKTAAAMAHAGDTMRKLRNLREEIEANCDYVGPRFPEEARRIHYGESESRGIYGEASREEAASL